MVDIILDIDLASDVKDFIKKSDDIIYDDVSLKTKIMSCDDNLLLRIGKTINSPTKIVSVDIVDDFF